MSKARFTTLGKVSSRFGRKNAIINGNFDIWQRGTSTSTAGYLADRWRTNTVGNTFTTSQVSHTLGQPTIPNNPTYYHRTAVTSVVGASNLTLNQHRIEGVETFSGQIVTLSFWAKADASKNIATEFAQYFGTGGSPSATVTSIGITTHALTTTWQKFTVTTTLPSILGKTLGTDNNDALFVNFWYDAGSTYNARTNTLGQQSGIFDIAQVQLELGDAATGFQQGTIGEEFALCQRYYEVINVHVQGSDKTGSASRAPATYNVRKRAVPTVTADVTSVYDVLVATEEGFRVHTTTSAYVNMVPPITIDAEL